MSLGITIGVGMLVGGLLLAATLYSSATETTDMSPTSLDSFSVTTCEEGTVVPLIYGRVRLTANLLWYGNLITEEITEEVDSGKGGDDEEVVSGYDYYLDIWEGICLGEADLISAYVADDPISVAGLTAKCSGLSFNDGTGSSYPTEPGAYANRLPGVAHIFLKRYHIGENTTMVPTFHFVMERQLSTPVNHTMLSNGANPAAVIYDLLIKAGASAGDDFDLDSFNDAADYWYSLGYGINLTFSRQAEVREMISEIFTYVDGCLRIDEAGQYVLKAYRPDDASEADLSTDDFIEFQFARRSYDDTYNDFKANFVDQAQSFTERTVKAQNPANRALVGCALSTTVDLTAFRDADTASRRLWEIMKKESYPEAQIDFKLTLKYSRLDIGSVVSVTHDDYGLSSAEFRIIQKDVDEIDSNYVSFEAVQMVESLFDDNYQTGGISSWSRPSYAPAVLGRQQIFELPYRSVSGDDPAYLLLAARQGAETGFLAYVSNTGTDYSRKDLFTTFSQAGTLDEEYPADTFAIDDEQGILFTPYIEDPEFVSLSRTDLFSAPRAAVIGDEIIAFQTVTPEGESSVRLTGCIRGVLNTPISTHASGSQIWLTSLAANILTGITAGDFYVKLLPYFGSQVIDIGDATPIHVTAENKARTPWPPYRIEAVRDGTTVTINWWPTDQQYKGAGVFAPEDQTDQSPFEYAGDFEIWTDKSGFTDHLFVDGTEKQYTGISGSFTFSIRARRQGRVSATVVCYTESADGTYIGPDA